MKRDPRWRGNVWNEKEIREDNDDCYEDKDKGSRIQELLILWAQTFILLSSKSKELLKRSSLDLKRKTEMENWYQHEEKEREEQLPPELIEELSEFRLMVVPAIFFHILMFPTATRFSISLTFCLLIFILMEIEQLGCF